MQVASALDRLHEQRAQRLLDSLQSELRAEMRLENDDVGRRGLHDPPRTAHERLQREIARLADPDERERVWRREKVARTQVG